jgi:hypothetical protein
MSTEELPSAGSGMAKKCNSVRGTRTRRFLVHELIFSSYFSSTIVASHGCSRSDWPGFTGPCERRMMPGA